MANVKIDLDRAADELISRAHATLYADRIRAAVDSKKFATVDYGKMMMRHDEMFHIAVERIENGYLLKVARNEGDVFKTYYAPDLKAAGEQITALAVTYELGGEDGKKA